MIQEPQQLLQTAHQLLRQQITTLSHLEQQFQLKTYQLSTLKLSLIQTIKTSKQTKQTKKPSY